MLYSIVSAKLRQKKYNELLDIIKNFTDDDELIRYLIAHFDRELFPSRDKYPRRSLREALRSHPQINKITDRVGLIPDLRRKLIYELLGAEPGDESTPLSA